MLPQSYNISIDLGSLSHASIECKRLLRAYFVTHEMLNIMENVGYYTNNLNKPEQWDGKPGAKSLTDG